jgi:hypothetical protein
MYSDGLARFATEKYTTNTTGAQEGEEAMYKHLTNYSLNKENSNFEADASKYKKPMKEVFTKMEKEGIDIGKIYHDIKDIVVKTLICIHP